MIEILPVTPSYPVKRPNKIVQDENKQQPDKEKQSQHNKDDEDNNNNSSNQPIEKHIDEII